MRHSVSFLKAGNLFFAVTLPRVEWRVPNYRCTTSVLILLIACRSFSLAADSLTELPQKAMERSQLTLPGSHPFVLRAKVLEITNPSNASYQTEIEEYWVAPNKWRRVVKTSTLAETLIVNGDKTSEQITGDYYSNWLRTIVAAIFDPGAVLKGVDLSHSADNPMIGGSKVCRRFTFMAGVLPVSNKVFSSCCFNKWVAGLGGKTWLRSGLQELQNVCRQTCGTPDQRSDRIGNRSGSEH